MSSLQGCFFQLNNGESICGSPEAIDHLREEDIEKARAKYLSELFNNFERLESLGHILPRTFDNIIVIHQIDVVFVLSENGIHQELLNIIPNKDTWMHQSRHGIIPVKNTYFYKESAIGNFDNAGRMATSMVGNT